MGLLIDGKWHDQWYDTHTTGGRFERTQSTFRNWITTDGRAGLSGEGGFPAASGRYHLYVSLACPWAHRTLILRTLKGLEGAVSLSVVNPFMGAEGWSFAPDADVIPDPIIGATHLHQIYTHVRPDFTGRVTVPVLYDRERDTIVSNESADIIRMFNAAFDGADAMNDHGIGSDFYPEALRSAIDAINAKIYDRINNGVYKAGFATTQTAYDEAVTALFAMLNELEGILGQQNTLVGEYLTEADWRLFTTLVRFDPVYVGHFKCNMRRIADYPNLWAYTRALYQYPGIAATVNMSHIKRHYYESHATINPTAVVPRGPEIDFAAPHDRPPLRTM